MLQCDEDLNREKQVESAARASAGVLEEQRRCTYTRISLTTKGCTDHSITQVGRDLGKFSVPTLCSKHCQL